MNELKLTEEELLDFLRVKDTLGFQAFLKVIKSRESEYKNSALSTVSDLGSLVSREQALGAMQALSILTSDYVELVKQHHNP